jgi:O-antigen/teichoic acid export membrane protein
MNLKEQIISTIRKNKDFSKNFIWRVVQTFGKQGTSFALFLIATAMIVKEEMGIYNYVFSALSLLSLLADFGISTATSKYVAQYNVEDKKKLPKVIFNTSIVILLIATIVTTATLIWGDIWFKEYYQYLIYLLPLVFLSPITALYDGIYRGLKQFKLLSILSLITGAISLVSSYFLIKSYGLVGALIAQDVLYIIYIVVLSIFYKTGWKISIDKKIIKDICSYSLAFGIASLGYYLFSRVNILIMGEYGLVEEIATYELLNKAFTIYLLPFSILGQVLAPYVTEIFALKKFKTVKDLYFRMGGILLLLIPIFIVVTMIGTKFAIQWIFPAYDTNILAVLLLPVTLTYAKHVFGAPIHSGMIVATGDASIMTIQNVISGIVNVALSYWAINRYGFVGMMWVTFFVQLISLVILHMVYIKRLKKHAKS